ncbi:cyclic nucleotide-binding domain-containing protein [Alphaproteobacteria bacterium]|nr:cyclic nucleotide-binding domain-containing protein [Alphaproteobacteria bacterium]
MKKIAEKKDRTIFEAGEKADSVYLIVSGEIGIFLPTNRTDTPNFILGENEIFGEMGVVDQSLRAGRANAITDVNLIKISQDEFNVKLAESDPFVTGLIRILVIRIRDLLKRTSPIETSKEDVQETDQNSDS